MSERPFIATVVPGMQTSDIIVIGAGIAGVSAAAELAADASVILLEMEAQPGYHASGRSAAYFAAAYGKKIIRDITGCCEAFLLDPPDEFSQVELLRPRDCMFFGREDQAASIEAMMQDIPRLRFLDASAVCKRVPVFSEDYLYGAAWDPKGGDLDVDSLLQAYLRQFRQRGGVILKNHRVNRLEHTGLTWRLTAGEGLFEAPVVVNAAGGWAEKISAMAGLEPLGIRPLRRTALTIDPPPGIDIKKWPELIDVNEEFYFKPDAAQIMISPADETPTQPCDAQPEELDVAMGVYRYEQATGLEVSRVNHSWAGLRTFAPDRVVVAGFDPRAEGFFWLAGQGGFGVMTAPAMAQLSNYLINDTAPAQEFQIVLEYTDEVSPARLM